MRFFILSMFVGTTCFAQFPMLSEDFDGDISDAFAKSVQIDSTRAKFENIKIGDESSRALVVDFADQRKGYPMMLRIPAGNASLSTGKNTYKISFDYKILSFPKDADGACVASIQRKKGDKIFNDDVRYFGNKVGETGKVELYSIPPTNGVNTAYFFISPKATGAKIAIDNFKIEKGLDYPDWIFEKDLFWGMKKSPLTNNFYTQNPQIRKMTKEDFFPFIDKFGQFKHKEWKNKIHSIEDLKKRAEEEKTYHAKLPDIAKRDKYFGYVNPNYKFKATGRFRTQKVDGKWFLVTPEGNLFWSMGVNTVGLFAPTPITKREHYFEDISDKNNIRKSNQTRHLFKEAHDVFLFETRTLTWKYGKHWHKPYAKVADTRARKWGVNTFGCWTQRFVMRNTEIPFTHSTSAAVSKTIKSQFKLTAYWRDVPDYFDPNFRIRTFASFAQDKKILNNPRCIGVFVDNELPWQPKTLMIGRAIVQSLSDQPAKIKFCNLLISKYKTIDALNNAWGSNYVDWNAFLKRQQYLPKTKASEEDLLKIEELYYREYFKVCRDALKAVSPDVLYFGCRFAWANPMLRKIATEYVDVVSYNWYKDDTLDLSHPEDSFDKPIIIGEYHFGNQDAGVFGGGLRPRKTMKERIESNNKYIASALKHPNIVGAHWFRWSDQITSGRDNDGENYSVGMVDICDTPIYEFVESVRKLSETMYDQRLKK